MCDCSSYRKPGLSVRFFRTRMSSWTYSPAWVCVTSTRGLPAFRVYVVGRAASNAARLAKVTVDARVTGKLVAIATRGRQAKGPFGLTVQEMRVVELLPKGMTNRDIGEHLGISEATVKTHLLHIYAKLGVNDRAAAVAVGFERGLLPRP